MDGLVVPSVAISDLEATAARVAPSAVRVPIDPHAVALLLKVSGGIFTDSALVGTEDDGGATVVVNDVVAVVVQAITELVGAGLRCRLFVITVGVELRVAVGHGASLGGLFRNTVPVIILIEEEGLQLESLIEFTVAVIVDAVAGLDLSRIYRCIRVVAVAESNDVPARGRTVDDGVTDASPYRSPSASG